MSATLNRTEPSLPTAPPAGCLTASLRDLRLALAQDTPANPSLALLAAAFHAAIDRLLALLITLAARFAAGEPIPTPTARQAPAPRSATTPPNPPLAWWRAPFRWCFAPNHPARPIAPARREHGALRITTPASCRPSSHPAPARASRPPSPAPPRPRGAALAWVCVPHEPPHAALPRPSLLRWRPDHPLSATLFKNGQWQQCIPALIILR